MFKNKISLICLIVLLFLAQSTVASDSEPTPEYQIKAGFLYNFIKFTSWPQNKVSDSNDVFVIGILGQTNPFGSAFDEASQELIRDRKLVIRYLGSFDAFEILRKDAPDQYQQTLESMKHCHVLFICASEKPRVSEILKTIEGAGVLTVSELPQFLEIGGAIHFVADKTKIGFDINLTAIGREYIEVRSQLLRIAKKVTGNIKERK